jgi:hypothetical protein
MNFLFVKDIISISILLEKDSPFTLIRFHMLGATEKQTLCAWSITTLREKLGEDDDKIRK